MIGYPLDSHLTYDEDGIPVFDRAITSEPLRELIKRLFSEGVLPDRSSELQVTSNNDMTVALSPGFAICNGCLKLETETRTLAIQAADATYDRIDTVVLRLNDNDDTRECDFYIITGTPASTPVHPELTRSGSIYEIGLADLFVGSNSSRVTGDKITDTRYNSERCGVISCIAEFDASALDYQLETWCAIQESEFETWSAAQQSAFTAWVATIQDILDDTAAGNLQAEIEEVDKARMGLEASVITFNSDGSISETKNGSRTLLTEFNSDGTINQTLKDANDAQLCKTLITFGSNTITIEEV